MMYDTTGSPLAGGDHVSVTNDPDTVEASPLGAPGATAAALIVIASAPDRQEVPPDPLRHRENASWLAATTGGSARNFPRSNANGVVKPAEGAEPDPLPKEIEAAEPSGAGALGDV
jgi:hypothetical protein